MTDRQFASQRSPNGSPHGAAVQVWDWTTADLKAECNNLETIRSNGTTNQQRRARGWLESNTANDTTARSDS